MAALVLFLAVIAVAQACSPTTTTTSSTVRQGARKTRAVEVVRVTVVTNQRYDPSRNDAHMETMKALVSNFARGARRQAKFITKMGMRCGGRPELPIN
ncbi:hypothetical protein ANCDUO_02674 [Ancylostoma duodenale]|uniref:Secreted protein n=1 Tax=Ancylostoma duodenale TaxID=51022 RepID=A0A0C2GZU3_9BILA|nr:hypothetical protein ANCDUO_02674 [Ancylostoma duodenale]